MALNNSTGKNKNLMELIAIAIIAYIPIFFINTPLWDDFTLSGSSFSDLETVFRDNGVYNVGIAHFHYFFNLINGDGVFFSRLFSFIFLVNLSCLFYVILDKIIEDATQKKILSYLFILLPFFGCCFTQIVMPYIICFNFFLVAVICLINYIRFNKITDLVLFLLCVSISYITNSFIFFIVPVVLIVYVLTVKEFKINRKLGFILLSTFFSVILFMIFKYFFMRVNPNSPYASYNKLTIDGLLFSGPVNSLMQIPKVFLNLWYLTLDIIKHRANILSIFLLSVPFYFIMRRMEWRPIPGKFFILGVVASCILIFAALYPYAVVGKINNNMYEYSSRFDMLLIVGVSLFMAVIVLFLFRNQYVGKIFLSFVFSVFFVCKLSVFINFYYQSKLQTEFYDSYLSKLDRTQSYVIHDKSEHAINWRFYEIGGVLRAKHSAENVLFIYGRSHFYKNDTLDKELVQKNIKINHYAIKDFNVNDFQYKPVEFIYKEKPDMLDFMKLIFGINPVEFKVKELTD